MSRKLTLRAFGNKIVKNDPHIKGSLSRYQGATTLKEQYFGICGLVYPVTRLSNSPTDLTFDRITSPMWFFRLQDKRLRAKKGSQEDPFDCLIPNRNTVQHWEHFLPT